VITQALFGQWVNFPSERTFCHYAEHHLRAVFPRLLHRAQLNKLMKSQYAVITAFGLYLVELLQAQWCSYEVLDCTAAVTRAAWQHGAAWLAGHANIG
jgi:hypothetical protein